MRLPVMAMPPPSSASSIEMVKPAGGSLRVLVVEDNVDAAETMALVLGAFGHDVRTAQDGLSGLEVAIKYQPHVVLLDIGLPGIDGFEVARRLRLQPTLKNIVLVAMTGYGEVAARQRSQEAGFDHHLVKPADFGKLQEILSSVSVGPDGEA